MRLAQAALVLLLSLSGFLALTSRSGSAGPAAGKAAPSQLVPLCDPDERGVRLVFRGRVLDYQGRPLARASVVAYHTDHAGLYNPPGAPTRVPRLRGVAVTDREGRFGFVSIRPAPYPHASEPAHIHVMVTAPAHHVRHLEVWFEGDPLITASHRVRARGNPSTVIVELARDAGGGWSFSHDIGLEAN